MITDAQLLSSQTIQDVLARMGNQGLHKTAGAALLGVDEVTLEAAVRDVSTKFAYQALRQAKIASALHSLESVVGVVEGTEKTAVSLNPRAARDKLVEGVQRFVGGRSKTIPNVTPPASIPTAPAGPAVIQDMSPGMGFAGKMTGGAAAPVPKSVKVTVPDYLQSYKQQPLVHDPNRAMQAASGAAAAPRAGVRRSTQDLRVLGEDPTAALQANAFLSNPKSIHNQIAAAKAAPPPAHDPFAALAARGEAITPEAMAREHALAKQQMAAAARAPSAGGGMFDRAAAQGRGKQASWKIASVLRSTFEAREPTRQHKQAAMEADAFEELLRNALQTAPSTPGQKAMRALSASALPAGIGALGGASAAGDYDNEHAQTRGILGGVAAGPLASLPGTIVGGGTGALVGGTGGALLGGLAGRVLGGRGAGASGALSGGALGAATGLVGGGVAGGLYAPYAAGRAVSHHLNESADRALARA